MNSTNPLVLEEWTFEPEVWNAYLNVERDNKKEDNIYFGIGILILCTPMLMLLRNTSFWIALAFTVPIAVLIPLLRQKIAYKHLNPHSGGTIQFFKDYMTVNGHEIEFYSDRRHIKSMRYFEKEGILLLEFTVEWITGKGPTNDEFRIPVPSNDKTLAQHIITKYS